MQIIYSDELVFFNKRFMFNKKWEYANFNLNSDGILTRVKGEKVKDWIDFKHVKLTVGKKTATLKGRPPLHHWIDENLLLCITDKRTSSSRSPKNWWIVFPDFDHLKKWLTNADLIIKAYEAKRATLLETDNKKEQNEQTEDEEPVENLQKNRNFSLRETKKEREYDRERERDREYDRKYPRIFETQPKDQIIHIYDESPKLKKDHSTEDVRSNDSSSYINRSESISRTFPRRVLREADLNYVNNSNDRLNYDPASEPMKRHNEFQPITPPPPLPPHQSLPPPPSQLGGRYPLPYEINYIKHENPQVTYIKHEKPPVTRIEYKTYDEFEEANRKYREYETERHEYDRKRSSSRRSRHKEEPIDVMNQSTTSIEPKSSLRDTSTDRIRTDKNGTIRRKNIQFNDQVEVRN